MALTYAKIAGLQHDMKNLEKAEKAAHKGIELSQKAQHIESEKRNLKVLSNIYEKQKKGLKAYNAYKLYIQMRDSIHNDATEKATLKQQARYEYEKKAMSDSIAYAKQQEINDAQIAQQKAEIKAKRNQQYALFSGIGLVLLFSGFMYNRFKVTQKQKIIIEETNEELNQTNEELAAQRDEIENQKNKIETAHQEIRDSIDYAKRIQEAILPSMDEMNTNLKNGFILYQPKDVVAGDFYWQESVNNKVFVAAADCTGHGVPGAMVSMVCSNALTKAVLEDGITDVGKILDRTREIVIEKLAKSGDVKDGMDISLACFDFNKMEMEWAGANNPLYLLRGNEIQITKGDKEPIGFTENASLFTKHTFDLQKGDLIYLLTDGYADQFGGEKGKKLGYKKFREKLLSIQSEEMDKQKKLLSTYFKEWQGSEEQVDDVCVIGIRI